MDRIFVWSDMLAVRNVILNFQFLSLSSVLNTCIIADYNPSVRITA